MKIVIDATFNPHGGSLIHLQEFILNLKQRLGAKNLLIYTKRENITLIGREALDACDVKIVKLPSINRLFWVMWIQFILPFRLMLLQYDILFSPGNISPIIKTTKVKAQWVATIGPFDKSVYIGLGFKDKLSLFLNKWLMLLSIKTSNMVIHESQYSLEFLTKKYSLKDDQQYLIECGKSTNFYHDLNTSEIRNEAIINMNSNDLLCVSHFYPYKNMERMVLAFFQFLDINPGSQIKLIICGLPIFKTYYAEILSIVRGSKYSKNVVFAGGVNQTDLRFAYSQCKLMIFPSLCESSGYTLIEAMSCGTAILATKLTAVPYTCQDAALYFDAFSSDDLCQKLNDLHHDKVFLLSLKEKALQRSDKLLSYQQSAELFHEFLEPLIVT